MRYKRKILEVEAVQITEKNRRSLGVILGRDNEYYLCFGRYSPRVNIGDYILTDCEGQKYPCKQSVFEQTWSRIDD